MLSGRYTYAADTGEASAAPHETITPAFAVPIANVPGKTMTALVVDYAPGGKSAPHRHGQAFVVGYVLAGAIRSRIDNGAESDRHGAAAPAARAQRCVRTADDTRN
ncbi:quercetin dioxygenase-like cupin family protein [Paraburkholderia sp. MM5496-R1]